MLPQLHNYIKYEVKLTQTSVRNYDYRIFLKWSTQLTFVAGLERLTLQNIHLYNF